jgi:hypothetical protein
MADSHLAWEGCNLRLIEYFCDKAITFHAMKLTFRVNSHDTASLLASVLQRVQAIICKTSSILNTIYSKHTTLMVEFVISITILTSTHSYSPLK